MPKNISKYFYKYIPIYFITIFFLPKEAVFEDA